MEIISGEDCNKRLRLTHRKRLREVRAHIKNEMSDPNHGFVEEPSRNNDEIFPITFHYPKNHLASLFYALCTITSSIDVSLVVFAAGMAQIFNPISPVTRGAMVATTFLFADFCNLQPTCEWRLLWNAAKGHGLSHKYPTENAESARNICRPADYGRDSILRPTVSKIHAESGGSDASRKT